MSGAILPVYTQLGVDYDREKEKITNFLTQFKGTAPQLSTLPVDSADDVAMDEEGVEESPSRRHTRSGSRGGRQSRGQSEAMDGASAYKGYKYMEQLQRIANREQEALVIDLEDVVKYEDTAASLVAAINHNAKRYADLFCQQIDAIMPVATKDISYKNDVLDVIMHQRMEKNLQARENDDTAAVTNEGMFPPQLLRRYNLYFKPLESSIAMAVREVRGVHLGKMITVRGVVTRVSEVKPFLLVNAYSCDMCGGEIFQDITQRQFVPLTECPTPTCQTNLSKGKLYMQTRASKFVPFQEVKIQEMADQVPVGHIPRSMTVHLYGRITRSMNPGDVVHIGGIFLPTPYTGFRAIRAGLLTDTYLEAQHVHQLKKQYSAMEMTAKIEEEIAQLKRDPALYAKLAQSIAPEIYGHEDVKKALLLLLVGGVTKNMGDGMKIRGDINVCLMGDPGVAKSQLLKYISKVAPRGVYTTGRGSSGVGLTAAVMRDPVTDEMVLEGGALVLADNGIACIDEFDKMDESDRTAIHEVMEQQTISISKAGITTTLNARTSILAAANPLYGRYNPRVSPVENINLPAALLSRFDVLFLILDTPARDDDERLAQHVTHVHMFNEHPELDHEPVDPILLRHYIALARQKRPTVPRSVSDYVVGAYVQLRKQQKEDEARGQMYTYTSARTLLAVLRLSQALARLRFSDEVELPDVDEALRLMEVSKASLHSDERDEEREADQTDVSKIYRVIRDMAAAAGAARRASRSRGGGAGRGGMEVDGGDADGAYEEEEDEAGGGEGRRTTTTTRLAELNLRDVRERIFAGGWVEEQLTECLREYESLGVLQVTGNRLMFV